MQTTMIIWPYLYIALYFILSLLPSEGAFFLLLVLYVLGGLIVSICYSNTAKGIRRPDLCRDLSYQDRRIKLWHLPCDLLIWGFILVRWIDTAIGAAKGDMGIGLSIMLLLLIGTPYRLTRIFMLWASASVCKEALTQSAAERKIPLASANLHIFLHLLPIADIINATLIYRRLIPIAWQWKQQSSTTPLP